MIERTTSDGIELIRLNHGKANALDLELAVEVESTFSELADSESRAVVLTGTGSIFSAGVDLFRFLDEGTPYVVQFLPVLDSLLRRIYTFPKPLVCAVNGHAIAGGCLLAICGDVRLMAEGSGKIGVPELLVGVAFPPYALEIFRATTSARDLERFVYSGRTVGPDEAVGAGLIDRVVAAESLEKEALQEASRLAGIAPDAFALTKGQLRSAADHAVRALGNDAESHTMKVWTSEAARLRIREYLDRTVGN